MPPRVTYWTGVWAPGREAHSNEIQALRTRSRRGPGWVVSFAPGQMSTWSPRARLLRLPASRWLALRAAAAWIERRGDVTHVFGELGTWHLLRAVGRRPVLFTTTVSSGRPAVDLYPKVSQFVAEGPILERGLLEAGVPPDKVTVIYPGIDLQRFRPVAHPPARPFRILFASSPSDLSELSSRGIGLLVHLARQAPDVEVVVLWRSWGRAAGGEPALRDRIGAPANLKIVDRHVHDMSELYGEVHATAALFSPGVGKSCPNSIIESLACGRPALISRFTGLADAVDSAEAGVVTDCTPESVTRGLERLRAGYDRLRRGARPLAERLFSQETFLASYQRLYARLAGRDGSPPTP